LETLADTEKTVLQSKAALNKPNRASWKAKRLKRMRQVEAAKKQKRKANKPQRLT
jgi:hypothetical protein